MQTLEMDPVSAALGNCLILQKILQYLESDLPSLKNARQVCHAWESEAFRRSRALDQSKIMITLESWNLSDLWALSHFVNRSRLNHCLHLVLVKNNCKLEDDLLETCECSKTNITTDFDKILAYLNKTRGYVKELKMTMAFAEEKDAILLEKVLKFFLEGTLKVLGLNWVEVKPQYALGKRLRIPPSVHKLKLQVSELDGRELCSTVFPLLTTMSPRFDLDLDPWVSRRHSPVSGNMFLRRFSALCANHSHDETAGSRTLPDSLRRLKFRLGHDSGEILPPQFDDLMIRCTGWWDDDRENVENFLKQRASSLKTLFLSWIMPIGPHRLVDIPKMPELTNLTLFSAAAMSPLLMFDSNDHDLDYFDILNFRDLITSRNFESYLPKLKSLMIYVRELTTPKFWEYLIPQEFTCPQIEEFGTSLQAPCDSKDVLRLFEIFPNIKVLKHQRMGDKEESLFCVHEKRGSRFVIRLETCSLLKEELHICRDLCET